jgi:hypothetical protein
MLLAKRLASSLPRQASEAAPVKKKPRAVELGAFRKSRELSLVAQSPRRKLRSTHLAFAMWRRAADPKKDADPMPTFATCYIFFAEHVLVLASHMPPAFWQSALVFAAVTSPANAGAVKASANASANIEIMVFMGVFSFEAVSPVRRLTLEPGELPQSLWMHALT